ncbi:MAG: hypothetical protein KF761_05170 [Salinibacterium sp.]|nr:hypothetical protein [Salinibacterium sp.]
MNHPTPRERVARTCSIAAATLMGGLAVFQAALAAGAPWGEAAFGGAQTILDPGLRVGAGAAALIWSAAALVVLRRAGHPVWAPLPRRALPVAVWVIAGYSATGVLLNAASPSVLERAIWVPGAFAISALTFAVAIASRRRRVVAPA